MTDIAAAFGLSGWPFRIVVDEEFASRWAGRREVRDELARRLSTMSALPHSTVQTLWADFGAGKSHTLRHIQHLLNTDSYPGLLAVYLELSASESDVFAVYRQIVASLEESGALSSIYNTPSGSSSSASQTAIARDVSQALRLLGSTDAASRDIASSWLRALPGFPNLRELRAHGIFTRIDSDRAAIEVISQLLSKLRASSKFRGLVVMIDEYQRIADSAARKRDQFTRALVSLFNAAPNGLHLILSMSLSQRESALALIPPELASRATTFEPLSLPFLDAETADIFTRDLLSSFREIDAENTAFPFSPEALSTLLRAAERKADGQLTPRILMEVMSSALLRAYHGTQGKPVLPIQLTEQNSI